MAGNKITWDIGRYNPDTHYVYRDSVPMDPNSLPTPIATLGQGISVYEDTNNIVEGNTYYYRVDAEKMGLYILGYEIEYVASLFDVFGDNSTVLFYMFNGNLNDEVDIANGTTGSKGTLNGSSSYISSIASLGQSIQLSTNTHIASDFNAASSSVSVSFFLRVDSFNDTSLNALVSLPYNSGTETFAIGFSNQMIGLIPSATGGSPSSLTTKASLNANTNYHVVACSDGSFYLNGVLQSDVGSTAYFDENHTQGSPKLLINSRYLSNTRLENKNNVTYDHFKVFNRILTESEADILYQEGTV